MWRVEAFLAHWFFYSLAGLVILFLLGGIRYIPNTKVGLVEKRTSRKGSVTAGIIALDGEAGFQPALLRGGVHYLLPGQYKVHIHPLVTIPQGKIGYVFARDGVPLPPTQALASNAVASDLQDAAGFLRAGGQRGPQRKILREGTYAINLAQFVVITTERVYCLPLEKSDEEIFKRMTKIIQDRDGFDPVVIKGTDDLVGIVTVHDGPSLPPGQIIAPTIGEDAGQPDTYHNSFQDPECFLRAGGQRGRQLQVLVKAPTTSTGSSRRWKRCPRR